MWESIKEIIGEGAPIIGGLLGGKAGGAVGELIASALGVDNSPESIEKALKNNPDAMIKLKELENSKEIAILQAQLEDKRIALDGKRVDNETEKLFLDDKGSARAMQNQALSQDDIFSKRFIYYFAAFWSFISVVYIFAITFIPIAEANTRFADTIIGFLLGTIIATLIGFFYGTSVKKTN